MTDIKLIEACTEHLLEKAEVLEMKSAIPALKSLYDNALEELLDTLIDYAIDNRLIFTHEYFSVKKKHIVKVIAEG